MPRRRAAAEDDHAGRRGRGRRNRGHVVPLRPGARHGRRTRGAHRRRARAHVHARQRAPRPVLRTSRIPTARWAMRSRDGAHDPGEALCRARAPALRRRRPSSRPCPTRCAAIRTLDFLDGTLFAPDASSSPGRFVDDRTVTPATTPTRHLLSLDPRAHRGFPGRCATSCGAGTRTGSGARRISVRSTPSCAGSTAARRLNSLTYQRIMRWNSRVGVDARARPPARAARRIGDPGRRHPDRACGRLPRVPARARSASCRSGSARSARPPARRRFTLYPLAPGTLYVNFGFWDRGRSRQSAPAGLSQPDDRTRGERARRD